MIICSPWQQQQNKESHESHMMAEDSSTTKKERRFDRDCWAWKKSLQDRDKDSSMLYHTRDCYTFQSDESSDLLTCKYSMQHQLKTFLQK